MASIQRVEPEVGPEGAGGGVGGGAAEAALGSLTGQRGSWGGVAVEGGVGVTLDVGWVSCWELVGIGG